MKKYKLKIKDDKAKWNDYGLGIEHEAGFGFAWLEKHARYGLTYNANSNSATIFAEEDINKLPYGFIQQHELIDVEEDLYHIVCPYTRQILKRDKDNYSIEWDTPSITFNTEYYQRKFTLKEIEDKYPNMVKMVKKCKK